jgi:threonine/homoserine/homoserine lactone efflux protein
MHFSNSLIFCGVAVLVTFTPGPAVLLAISNSVAAPDRAGARVEEPLREFAAAHWFNRASGSLFVVLGLSLLSLRNRAT